MAEFNYTYEITKRLEGGYANHPQDKGKETYRGISRRFFPNWEGWRWLDTQAKPIKNNTVFKQLEPYVMRFYIATFWHPLQLGFLAQKLADQIFDFAVHSGKKTAIKNLQSVLNRQGENLKIDGVIGKNTIAAIQSKDANNLALALLKQRANYIKIISKDQPHWQRAWQNRIDYLRSLLPSPVNIGVVALLGAGIFF